MPFVLWTAAAVRDLITEKLGVALAVRSLRRYLQKWGFPPQKPTRKAWQQSATALSQWLEEKYPAIAKRAKTKGARIYWVDERGVSNQANSQRGYSPVGQT